MQYFQSMCRYGIISPIYPDYNGLMNIFSNGNKIGLTIKGLAYVYYKNSYAD